jgi:hypothetical protein
MTDAVGSYGGGHIGAPVVTASVSLPPSVLVGLVLVLVLVLVSVVLVLVLVSPSPP